MVRRPKVRFVDMFLSWPVLVAVVILLTFLLDVPGAAYRFHRRLKLLRAIPVAMSSLPPVRYPWYWFLGHIPVIYKQDEELLMKGVEQMNNPEYWKYSLGKLWLGFVPSVHISHPKLLKPLLKEPKSELVYNLLVPWLGKGLLISEGQRWLRSRRLLTPAFHFEILKGYIPVYNDRVSVLLKNWTECASENKPVLVHDSMSALSLDIILRCAFSFEGNCQTGGEKHPYAKACCDLVYQVSERIMNPLYINDWFYWYLPHGRKTKRLCDFVHQYAEEVIAKRRINLRHVKRGGTSNESLQNEVSKTRKYLDFLDILLTAVDEEGHGMSALHVRNEVDTFLFEGHDTTTSGMSWTLYCLAKHPEHQDQVRQEVRGVLMGRERLEYDDLKDLKYTTWCIKEAMRLYPPVFFFFRRTTEEVELNNFVIPKDIFITIWPFFIHRNIQVWERPNEFDPLRFMPANFKKHDPFDYIPFSAGSRNCIGQNFALNEMKVVVGTIVSRFVLKLAPNHKVEIVPRVVLRTKDDIKVLLEPVTEEN
jgi:cytochrome P450